MLLASTDILEKSLFACRHLIITLLSRALTPCSTIKEEILRTIYAPHHHHRMMGWDRSKRIESNIKSKHPSGIDSTCFPVSVDACGNSRKEERQGARPRERERKREAECSNTKNLMRTMKRQIGVTSMCGVESKHEESRRVVRIIRLHALMIIGRRGLQNKSNVAII